EQRRALGRWCARGQCHTHGAGDAVDLLPDADELIEVGSLFRSGPNGFDHKEVAGDATPADGVCGIFDGHVVIDDEGFDGNAVGLRHFTAHIECHAVARVVVDDVEHTLG